MKRIPIRTMILALGLLLAALAGAIAKQSGDSKPQPVKWKGLVTDSMCGAKHMMAGDDAKCARACVKGGARYALLVGDKVYELAGLSEELDGLAGTMVNAVGALNSDGKVVQLTSVQPVKENAATNASKNSQNDATPAPTETIEGLVRDIACPIQEKRATARNFSLKCALECARLGSPLIILTDDGTLYMPISSSMPDQDQRERLSPFVGKYVQVRGQVFERQGTRAIMIQDITELKGVKLMTDAE
jgi:hypothetical protein